MQRCANRRWDDNYVLYTTTSMHAMMRHKVYRNYGRAALDEGACRSESLSCMQGDLASSPCTHSTATV